MGEFGGWEELDIDDSDIVKPPRHHLLLQQQQQTPPNILPSKRPPHIPSQIPPTTDGILNRFKKQNVTQLTNPRLSIPSDLPPLEPCSDAHMSAHTNTTAGTEGLDDHLPKHFHQTQTPNNSDQVRARARVCRPNNNKEDKEQVRASDRIRWIIPGPAGAVQRALHKNDRDSYLNERAGSENAAISTVRHEEDDVDFEEGPWLCAIDYLRRENPDENVSSKSTIDFIKKRGNIDRIPQVLGIIKTCMPNKLGSMFVTLKDRTGTIGGSIHHKVVEESQIGRDISVGAVLLLRQVVVFSPTPWAHYLNITLTNVVKVFKKGSCLPERQKGALSSKNWRSLNKDMFMEAGTAPLSKNRAPQCDTSCSPKKYKVINNLEGRKDPPQEDGCEQEATHRKIASSRNSYVKGNIFEGPPAEQNTKAGTSCASQNFEVCCNMKSSMPVTIDWNEEVEMLMADQLDLFT